MDLGREVHEAPTPSPRPPSYPPKGGRCHPGRRPPPPAGTPPFRWESPSGWNHSPLGEQGGGLESLPLGGAGRGLWYLSCFLLCYLFRPIPISLSCALIFILCLSKDADISGFHGGNMSVSKKKLPLCAIKMPFQVYIYMYCVSTPSE